MDNLKKIIESVKLNAKENLVPIVRDKTLGKLLSLSREIDAINILEIGTATGYSGLNLLEKENSFLTTIEKNEVRYNEAKNNFEKSGVQNRVCQILDDAQNSLEKLADEKNKFDLIFLDGPKGQYMRYLPYITTMLRTGGVLFADNILLGGLIKDETRVNHKNRAMVKNMKKFLGEIQNSQYYETDIFEIEDGFAICRKK